MSSVSINHEQVRRLSAALSDIRMTPSEAQVRTLIGRCLGLSLAEYELRLDATSRAAPDGMILDRATDLRLTRNLSSAVPAELKNKQRIKLIADAFGWRDDAFMHALKNMCPSKETQADGDARYWAGQGYRDMDNWSMALRSRAGLCLIGGPTGSGKTNLMRLSILSPIFRSFTTSSFYDLPFDASGREGRNRKAKDWLADVARANLENVVCFDEACTSEEMLSLVELAHNHLVIAVVHSNSVIDTIRRVRSLVPASAFDRAMSVTRGVASVCLVRRLRNPAADVEDIRQRYDGRFPLCENAFLENQRDVDKAVTLSLIPNSSVSRTSWNNPADDAVSVSGLWRPFSQQAKSSVEAGETDEAALKLS